MDLRVRVEGERVKLEKTQGLENEKQMFFFSSRLSSSAPHGQQETLPRSLRSLLTRQREFESLSPRFLSLSNNIFLGFHNTFGQHLALSRSQRE